MNDITIGETRQWEGATFTFVWTSTTLDMPHHCAGCDEDFVGDANIWRRGDQYTEWCNGCHGVVVASGQGVCRG